MEININPEDVNRLVSEAILESTIGVQLKQIVKDKFSGFDMRNAIRKAVDAEVNRAIHHILNTEHGEEIRSAVRDALGTKIVSDIACKALEDWFESKSL